MITKQELEKLKELAKAATPGSWNYDSGNCEVETLEERRHVAIVSNDNITQHEDHLRPVDWECDGYYIAAANPATVLRLIEALDVAIKSLIKIRVNCSCTELCMCSEDDVYIAQEALNKIYGVE